VAVAEPVTHHDAVIAAVDAAVSVPVADAPGVAAPYVAVYATPGGNLSGSLGAPDDDIRCPVQVTCVGRHRKEAQYLQAAVRVALLDESNVSVTGRSVMRVSLEQPSGVTRDDDVGERPEQRVWFSTDVFHVHTTPA
jgi:hypothetical protein